MAAASSANRLYWVKNIPQNPFTSPTRPNDHAGVNALLWLMSNNYLKFYRSDRVGPLSGPYGLIAADDVVLIKVNAQWKYRGCTNSDVIRGLIQKILDHPDGFSGEVVIFENGQGFGNLNCENFTDWSPGYPDATQHANANDESHSFLYLVEHIFRDSRVSSFLLDTIRSTFIDDFDHITNGYRLWENVSYPCFTTAGGHRVELRAGLWTGTSYSQNLKLINVPVLKDHWYTNLTCCLKNTYGILSMSDGLDPYFSERHPPGNVGQIWGKMMAAIKIPVLNLVDAIWVSQGILPILRGLPGYPPPVTTRTNQLLASQDPVALDYWAAKYILYPIDNEERHHPDFAEVDTWLTAAQDTINDYGGLYDPGGAIYVKGVTKGEAAMAVYTLNMAGLVPAINFLLQD